MVSLDDGHRGLPVPLAWLPRVSLGPGAGGPRPGRLIPARTVTAGPGWTLHCRLVRPAPVVKVLGMDPGQGVGALTPGVTVGPDVRQPCAVPPGVIADVVRGRLGHVRDLVADQARWGPGHLVVFGLEARAAPVGMFGVLPLKGTKQRSAGGLVGRDWPDSQAIRLVHQDMKHTKTGQSFSLSELTLRMGKAELI